MTAPTFNGTFPHNWTAEILPNRPMILPSRHCVYPGAAEEVEKGALEVLVRFAQPSDASPFLATCALGFRDPAVPMGIWSCPHPDWICAVSGGYAYLIDASEPSRFTMIRYRPVLEIVSYLPEGAPSPPGSPGTSSDGLLLFLGHHSVLAWGRKGEAWESDRVSSEGITGVRIEMRDEGDILHGQGWDMHTDRDRPFALDLRTGQRL